MGIQVQQFYEYYCIMSKCQHGAKFSMFCISRNCSNKDVGGCSQCMRKKHKHPGEQNIIKEIQINQLIKKFHYDYSVKPKCRTLQQTILKYSTQIKKEFENFADSFSTNIMNQIGYPTLWDNSMFLAYRHIKKGEFQKISPKELRDFYDWSQNLPLNTFLEQQKKLYIKKIKQKIRVLAMVQNLLKKMSSPEREFSDIHPFSHDEGAYLLISQTVEQILQKANEPPLDLKNNSKQLKERKIHKTIQKNEEKAEEKTLNTNSSPLKKFGSEMKKYESRANNARQAINELKQKEKNKQKQKQAEKEKLLQKRKKQEQLEKEKSKQKEKQRQKQRLWPHEKSKSIGKQQNQQDSPLKKRLEKLSSLDKDFKKSNKFDLMGSMKERQKAITDLNDTIQQQQILYTQNHKMKQSLELQTEEDKASPRRRFLEAKQTQINQKKQKLIDLMKGKDDSPVNRFKHALHREKKEFELNLEKTNLSQSNNNSQIHNNATETGQSAQINDRLYFGLTNLPMIEQRKNLQSEKVTKRTIVINVDDAELEKNPAALLQSPIRRNMKKMKDHSPNSVRRTQSINQRREVRQQDIGLNESEQKSMYLLLQAINHTTEEAIVYLKKSLNYCDHNLSAAQYLSYLYLESEQFRQALTLCNKMLEKLQNSLEKEGLSWHILINKGAALNSLGRYSEALNVLAEAQRFKESEKISKMFGDAYFSLGMLEKAIENYQKAINLDETYDEAHYNLAACYFTVQNFHNAKFQVMKALQISPNEEAYILLKKQLGLRMKEY